MFKTAVTRGEKELVRSERSLKQCPRDSVQDERRGLEKREICLFYQNKENAGRDWGGGGGGVGHAAGRTLQTKVAVEGAASVGSKRRI